MIITCTINSQITLNSQIKKKNIPVETYLAKAAPHNPIRNAVPEAIADAKKHANDARTTANRIQWIGGGILLVTILLTLFALILPVLSLVEDTNAYLQAVNDDNQNYERLLEKVNLLEAEIARMKFEGEPQAGAATNEPDEPENPFGN